MERLLGKELFEVINSKSNFDSIIEIRLRLGKEIMIKTHLNVFFLEIVATSELLNKIISVATNESKYAYEEEISNGYIDYSNGIRIGLCGDCTINNKGITTIKNFYTLCIRIPHEITGCANKISFLTSDFNNTLIISPPGCGKTTLLREMARKLGDIYDVFIVDEREEICGKNLILKHGKRSDIIQGVPKKKAYERAIRTMSPQIIVCDELFGEDDENAIKKIIASGVKVLATYHSDDIHISFGKGIFLNRVLLSSVPTPGSIKSIMYKGELL